MSLDANDTASPAELLRRQEGRATILTLNRPAKANALSASLVESLMSAVDTALRDSTRLLVLEGNGKHFCAGFDFTDYEKQSEGDLLLRFVRIEALLQRLFHAPIETLVLTQGRNFGAGADLVAACQHRIATPESTFRMPGLRFGLVLGTRRLAHRVGDGAARELLAETKTFDADEALRLGFLTRLESPANWPEIIADLAQRAQVLSGGAAAALHQATTPDTRALDMAALAESASTPGLRERIRQFREAGR